MFLTEYNEELHERTCREEGWQEGREVGIILGTISTLRKLGYAEDDIRKMLRNEYGLTESEMEEYLR